MSRRRLGNIKHIVPSVITTRGDLVRGDSSGNAERLAVGTTLQFLGNDGTDVAWEALPTAGDTTSGILETATQAEQETGTATDKIVTPGRQHFHPGSAKGWVSFNGTTVTGDTDLVGVGASYNVTSLIDNGTGNYTINWDTDFSSGDYAVADAKGASAGIETKITVNSIAAGALTIDADVDAGTNVDPTYISILAFGDQ